MYANSFLFNPDSIIPEFMGNRLDTLCVVANHKYRVKSLYELKKERNYWARQLSFQETELARIETECEEALRLAHEKFVVTRNLVVSTQSYDDDDVYVLQQCVDGLQLKIQQAVSENKNLSKKRMLKKVLNKELADKLCSMRTCWKQSRRLLRFHEKNLSV